MCEIKSKKTEKNTRKFLIIFTHSSLTSYFSFHSLAVLWVFGGQSQPHDLSSRSVESRDIDVTVSFLPFLLLAFFLWFKKREIVFLLPESSRSWYQNTQQKVKQRTTQKFPAWCLAISSYWLFCVPILCEIVPRLASQCYRIACFNNFCWSVKKNFRKKKTSSRFIRTTRCCYVEQS